MQQVSRKSAIKFFYRRPMFIVGISMEGYSSPKSYISQKIQNSRMVRIVCIIACRLWLENRLIIMIMDQVGLYTIQMQYTANLVVCCGVL